MKGGPAGTVELPAFARRTLGLFTRRRVPWDAVVRVRPFSRRYLLTDPEDVRHVLMAGDDGYRKTPEIASERGRERVGRGLLSRSGKPHRERRRLLMRLFHRRAVASRGRDVTAVIDGWIEERADGERLDLAEEMATLTRHAILRVLFGRELRGEARREVAEAIAVRRRYTEHLYHGRLPFRDRLPTRISRANRRAVATLDRAIRRAIERRRSGEAGRDDLIADLVRVTDREGRGLSDDAVRDEVLSFTHTGYETLGDLLTWSWHLLAEHPEVERTLHEEVDATEDGRGAGTTGGTAAASGRAGPTLVDAVLEEALRLYPTTWIYARVPIADDRLPGGAAVRPGDTLYVCPWLLHRHPAHFTDPERFDPSRFLEGRPPRFVYLPFGDGPHRCLGEHLALLEGGAALRRIGRRFRFRPEEPGPLTPRGGVTLRPRDGYPVTVERR